MRSRSCLDKSILNTKEKSLCAAIAYFRATFVADKKPTQKADAKGLARALSIALWRRGNTLRRGRREVAPAIMLRPTSNAAAIRGASARTNSFGTSARTNSHSTKVSAIPLTVAQTFEAGQFDDASEESEGEMGEVACSSTSTTLTSTSMATSTTSTSTSIATPNPVTARANSICEMELDTRDDMGERALGLSQDGPILLQIRAPDGSSINNEPINKPLNDGGTGEYV
jgi:hypothetical protein